MKKRSTPSFMTIVFVYYGVNIIVNLIFSLLFSRLYPLLRTVEDQKMITHVYRSIGVVGMVISFIIINNPHC